MNFKVEYIQVHDNYIWIIRSKNKCAVIDPGDATKVLTYLNKHKLTLEAILITHHHADHTAGIKHLAHLTNTIYGPSYEDIPFMTHPLKKNDTFILFNHEYQVLFTPGHTAGHISYYTEGRLFCGDVLFSGGCGRVFEGPTSELYNSVQSCLSLPDDTLVFCGHEYTENNLKFASHINPTNTDLKSYVKTVQSLRQNNKPTLPTSINLEKKINPFCRCFDIKIKESIQTFTSHYPTTDAETFIYLRELKNTF